MKMKNSNDHDQGKGQPGFHGQTQTELENVTSGYFPIIGKYWKMSHLDIFKLLGNIGKFHIWIFSNYWEILEDVTSGYFQLLGNIGKYWKMSHLDIFSVKILAAAI